MSETAVKLKALTVLFPGFNTLDMNGPFEVLARAGLFEMVTAAENEITRSAEGVQVKVGLSCRACRVTRPCSVSFVPFLLGLLVVT